MQPHNMLLGFRCFAGATASLSDIYTVKCQESIRESGSLEIAAALPTEFWCLEAVKCGLRI